ncbi:hypothetical protein [Candidatus Spongiihabitans sp.]|uniref:hypothetical protein n=1 Tax=Candidatus Spongiihabitans sp. TaxID=3101308 RepID=UPI003C7E8369
MDLTVGIGQGTGDQDFSGGRSFSNGMRHGHKNEDGKYGDRKKLGSLPVLLPVLLRYNIIFEPVLERLNINAILGILPGYFT